MSLKTSAENSSFLKGLFREYYFKDSNSLATPSMIEKREFGYMFIFDVMEIVLILMDDFEKEYPDFDWKNTPAYKHPNGKDCPCPKHAVAAEHQGAPRHQRA